MFEKEAEEIANKKLCSERICYNRCNFNSPKHHRCGEWHRCYESAKEGAEFGFNKAKEEWKKHFLQCSSPFCLDKFSEVKCYGELGNMAKKEGGEK